MVSGSADAQQTQVTTGGVGAAEDGDMVNHIIRCSIALEGALGRVRAPPAAVAALRRGLVDAGLVIAMSMGDDWGSGGSRDDGGWRHFFGLLGRRIRSQVTLGWEDCCGGNGGRPVCFYIRGGIYPHNRYIRRTKCGRSLSLMATEVPPFRHPHDLNFSLVLIFPSLFFN